MNLICSGFTDVSVLSAVRQAVSDLESASGSISSEDRLEFITAYNSLMTILESHMGGVL